MVSSQSVMVVDDEEDLARLYSEYLQIIGLSSDYFTDPFIALDHFQNNPDKYSTIIVDFKMPGMSGLEFTNKIRKLSTDVKIFLISAYDIKDKENSLEYKQVKIEGIIQKPIKLSYLKQQIIEITTQ